MEVDCYKARYTSKILLFLVAVRILPSMLVLCGLHALSPPTVAR